MGNVHIVERYYAACMAGDVAEISRLLDPDCVVDEPSFLPYGQVAIIGAAQMMTVVADTFFKVFEPEATMRDTRYFEADGRVIASATWSMTGRYTGRRIDGHYQEYFEFRGGRISLMRPFYHAVAEIAQAFDAARAAGIDVDGAARGA